MSEAVDGIPSMSITRTVSMHVFSKMGEARQASCPFVRGQRLTAIVKSHITSHGQQGVG